jgi:hypothetical protein
MIEIWRKSNNAVFEAFASRQVETLGHGILFKVLIRTANQNRIQTRCHSGDRICALFTCEDSVQRGSQFVFTTFTSDRRARGFVFKAFTPLLQALVHAFIKGISFRMPSHYNCFAIYMQSSFSESCEY